MENKGGKYGEEERGKEREAKQGPVGATFGPSVVRTRCTCGSSRLEKLRVPVQLINDVSGRVVVGGACLCDSATAPPLLDIATASYRPKGLL